MGRRKVWCPEVESEECALECEAEHPQSAALFWVQKFDEEEQDMAIRGHTYKVWVRNLESDRLDVFEVSARIETIYEAKWVGLGPVNPRTN